MPSELATLALATFDNQLLQVAKTAKFHTAEYFLCVGSSG